MFFLLKPAHAFNVALMLHYGLAGMFTWLFLRRIGLAAPAAAIGALGFMFSGFMAGHRVHAVMVETAAWMPGVLWALASWCRTGRVRWLPAIAACVALQIFAGYMQIVLMTWMMAALFIGIGACASRETRLRALRAAGALAAGALLAGLHLLNVHEFATRCTRAMLTFDQFSDGAFPIRYLLLSLFPFAHGTMWHTSAYAGVPLYHGVENYSEMACYAGIAAALAALVGFLNSRHRALVVLAGAAAALSLLFMVGPATPFWHVLYHVPIVNKFRLPARYSLVFQFSLAMLGALGFDAMVSKATPFNLIPFCARTMESYLIFWPYLATLALSRTALSSPRTSSSGSPGPGCSLEAVGT